MTFDEHAERGLQMILLAITSPVWIVLGLLVGVIASVGWCISKLVAWVEGDEVS